MLTEKNILHYETTAPKDKPVADDPLAFGTIFTDHMIVMDYTDGTGWHDPRIEPYKPFLLDPAAIVLHYGQTVLEGLKAYLNEDKEVVLFRPEENMKRLNRSND